LMRRSFTARLSPKVSVVIDGGGPVNLDALAADVRLRAATRGEDQGLEVSIGGDAASAIPVGFVSAAHGAEAAARMLDVLAKRGDEARARAVAAADGADAFRSVVADLLIGECAPRAVSRSHDIVGAYRLLNGSHAYGVGLAFGHADASRLESLLEAAKQSGASKVIPAPGRTIIAIGLWSNGVSDFVADAEQLDFIVRPDDPRRFIVACAGAPDCASAHIATRAMAPRVAAQSAKFLDKSFTIHLSGCAKGCAHPAPAALTVVGMPEGGALVHGGTARDAPFTLVPLDRLPAAIADAVRENCHA
jgi:precorrin-3B synthase